MNTSKVKAWRKHADALVAQHTAAKATLLQARKAMIDCEEEKYATEEAQKITQAIAETIQEEAHDRIAGVVSKCLATVFPDPYTFKIRFERARGRTEANLIFTRDGMETDPLGGSGGGAVDIAAFALRLSSLMLSRPASRKVVVVDEPFKFVSADRRVDVRMMLEGLAQDLGVQFIMVTHIEELQCGNIVEIE